MKGAALCLLAIISVASAATTACPMVSCSSDLGDGVCFKSAATTNTIQIHNCASGKWCATATFAAVTADTSISCTTIPDTPTPTAVTDMYPGYDCSANSECASGTCGSSGCTGITNTDDACVAWSTVATAANNKKMCGAGYYCDAGTNKCVAASDPTDCTSTPQCTGRKSCINKKCTALASLEKDDICSTYYCASGLVCSAGKCITGESYSKGTYGGLCTSDDECGDANTDCDCSPAVPTTKGQGTCGAEASITPTIGITAWDKSKSAISGASYSCPTEISKLSVGIYGCDGTMSVSVPDYSQDSCFNGYIFMYGTIKIGSGFGLYASVAAFLAFLLA